MLVAPFLISCLSRSRKKAPVTEAKARRIMAIIINRFLGFVDFRPDEERLFSVWLTLATLVLVLMGSKELDLVGGGGGGGP